MQRDENIATHAEGGFWVTNLGSNQSCVDKDAEIAAAIALEEGQDGSGWALSASDGSRRSLGAGSGEGSNCPVEAGSDALADEFDNAEADLLKILSEAEDCPLDHSMTVDAEE